MSLLQDVILRDTRAAQPAATAVSEGALYFVTDELVLERSSGSAWESVSPASIVANDSITYAKIQNISAASKLLGRGSASGAGDTEEITVGTGLAMTGTTLSASGGGSGKIAQVVNTQTGALATGSGGIPLDDTIPQNTEGDQYMSLSITPTNAASKLKIDVVAQLTVNAVVWVIAALFQDANANALAAVMELAASAGDGATLAFTHYMTAGTTSATTFKVRGGRASYAGTVTTFNGSGAARFFGGVMASSITITEILP